MILGIVVPPGTLAQAVKGVGSEAAPWEKVFFHVTLPLSPKLMDCQMNRRLRARQLGKAGLLLSLITLSACSSQYARECSLGEQMGAVFVQSLQFSHHALDRMADDAAGCSR